MKPTDTDRRGNGGEQLQALRRAVVEVDESLRRHVMGSAADGYIHRDWSLELHLRVRPQTADVGPGDLVAVFERDPDCDLGIKDFDAVSLDQANGPFPVCRDRRDMTYQQPVLVFIGERIEKGEPVFARLVPSLVRLERGSQVVDEVAHNDAPLDRRGLHDLDIEAVLASVTVQIGPQSIRLASPVGADFHLEGFKMGIRPCELEQHAGLAGARTAGPRRELTITKVHRDPERGFWRARVTGADGITIDVDRSAGAWFAQVRTRPGARSFERRDVLPAVAAALQAKVRPLEAAEEKGKT